MHIGAPLPSNPIEELEKNKKLAEEKLSGKELYELKKRQKGEVTKKEGRKEKLREAPEKVKHYILYAVIGAAIIGSLGWFIATRPHLPPTSQQNHSEQSPPAHIVTQPIPDIIQRHMLEHADGRNRPGIIIQYNCNDFDCEPGLVQKLTTLVEEYPDNVYLAPNTYDGTIILTKLGKIEILDGFDEQAIKNFIE